MENIGRKDLLDLLEKLRADWHNKENACNVLEVLLIRLLGEEPEDKECDCESRSWYGDWHDSACPFAGQYRED